MVAAAMKRNGSTNGDEDREYLDLQFRIRKARPVSQSSILLSGTRSVGKDAVTDALKGVTHLAYKVECDSVFRPTRQGDAIATATGVHTLGLEDLEASVDGYLASYHEDVIYAIPPQSFLEGNIPVLHVVGVSGLEALSREKTLPNTMNVLLTLDSITDADLEPRIIARLKKYNELPPYFESTSATPEQRARIDERLRYMRKGISAFEEQRAFPYHAIFFNDTIAPDDFRCLLYNENSFEVATKDIALRLQHLFYLYSIAREREHIEQEKITSSFLHHRFVSSVIEHLFKANHQSLRPGLQLRDRARHATSEYARRNEIEPEFLDTLLDRTSVEHKVCSAGTIQIYLTPTSTEPLAIAAIQDSIYREDFRILPPDFHVLGIISSTLGNEFGIRPQYDIKEGVLKGISFSLTHRQPVNQPKKKYHQLWIGYK